MVSGAHLQQIRDLWSHAMHTMRYFRWLVGFKEQSARLIVNTMLETVYNLPNLSKHAFKLMAFNINNCTKIKCFIHLKE